MGRILTIEIEIVDKEQAQWIWDCHRDCFPQHGVDVRVIMEGKLDDQNDGHDDSQNDR